MYTPRVQTGTEVAYYRKDQDFEAAVRWTAPEVGAESWVASATVNVTIETLTLPNPHHSHQCLGSGVFTEMSDVWSFAMVLYEIYSFGQVGTRVRKRGKGRGRGGEGGGKVVTAVSEAALSDERTVLFRHAAAPHRGMPPLAHIFFSMRQRVPYHDVPDEKVTECILQGQLPEAPPAMPPILYVLCEQCWSTARPHFAAICSFFSRTAKNMKLALPGIDGRVHPDVRLGRARAEAQGLVSAAAGLQNVTRDSDVCIQVRGGSWAQKPERRPRWACGAARCCVAGPSSAERGGHGQVWAFIGWLP